MKAPRNKEELLRKILGLQALENKKYVVMFCLFVIQVVILDLHLQCHSIAFFSFLCQFIVILVWDVLKNLKKCLPSLKMQKKDARLCQQQLSAWFQDG